MASPPSDTGHPGRPMQRRNSSARDTSPNQLRHSPTLLRAPIDESLARERQRTMDADMAMQLSRARNTSLVTPISPQPSHQVFEESFMAFSPQEEEDLLEARHPATASTTTLSLISPAPASSSEPALPLPPPAHHQLAGPSAFPNRISQSPFDFASLDEFAALERARSGVSSVPAMAGATEPVNALAADLRAKLSAVMPAPEPDSTGPQRRGKLAMFEGTAGAPPASLPSAPSFPNRRAASMFEEPYGDRPEKVDDRYRYSFYSNGLGTAIHAKTLSDLPSPGQTFADLFQRGGPSSAPTHQSGAATPSDGAGDRSANGVSSTLPGDDDEPGTWWLDVLCPTDDEMRLLSKVFNIHPLTTEDILMEETREKIELFRNYYLVCFRSFDQDPYSPTHLEPLNMYIVVFREGTLSFHFHSTNHPTNVRRRIKQLKDYINVTSDWISYALIDDITDAFGPLIQSIEYEVDNIDELVLILSPDDRTDMLRRIGTCRKKVMGLLRLMGNKADVVKGLAKRCNENWSIAPKSDIGLYLSDIQDHLITMTQNLNHYEKILSRSHSNYLAQISIEMTDANNQINDVLTKLTALGTILVPMNVVTGLWGMNVHVPGEGVPGYKWFGGIVGMLVLFAVCGIFITYRFMRSR